MVVPTRNLWAAINRRAAIVAGSAAAMGWSRVAVAAALDDEEDDASSSGQVGPKITDRVYFDFKISGRTKALVNPKWEKLIARDKRASGFTDEEFSQVCPTPHPASLTPLKLDAGPHLQYSTGSWAPGAPKDVTV